MLARWSSWGAVPDVFDESKDNWAGERAQLQQLLSADEYAAARRTTVNAHFTAPAYAAAVWDAVRRLGFDRGDVLEPGSGSGTFIGLAPTGAHMTGVELDGISSAIAKGLYPAADIRNESFADSRLLRDTFDLTIGNVPFGNVTLHDPVFNPNRHSLHNHFIIKSLQLTRPGGLVAVLTSHFTLDAANPSARREMNGLADMVGAVRLPSGAHRRSAGTEALTDLLILRRREPGTPPVDHSWETVVPVSVATSDNRLATAHVNAYFTRRPKHVLGTMTIGESMFGAETLHVVSDDLTATAAKLQGALQSVVDDALEFGHGYAPRSREQLQERAARRRAEPGLWDGTIVANAGNSFSSVRDGYLEDLKVPRNAAAELHSLLSLRDTAKTVLQLEAASVDDTAELEAARGTLRQKYNRYQSSYGPLNRFTTRPTGRVDEHGEAQLARITPPAVRILRQDPFGSIVMALELFDEEAQRALPAAILSQRVVVKREQTYTASTPAEAIALNLDRDGQLELATIAGMLGINPGEAREALAGLVFDDPATGELVHGPEYLSGNVRTKLSAARAAAAEDPRFEENVTALAAALPADLTSAEIHAKLGAVWIDPATHQDFLRELIVDPHATVRNPLPGKWDVSANKHTLKSTNEWGTPRRPAPDIAESLMEQKAILVYDTYETPSGGKRFVFNAVESEAAQEKAQQMQDRFSEWVWEDPERATRLAAEYNRRFNSIVLRDYTGAGDYLTLPGLAANFVPLQHQRDLVARAIVEPTVGAFHEVGAGKTASMVMAVMELRRMGLITKAAVVVPNHMLEQFAREWLQLYPQARILAASSDDLAGDKRRLFVARAAANDWDAVIFTRTAFERVPLAPDVQANYIDAQVYELRAAIDALPPTEAKSIKAIEKAVISLEESHKRLIDSPRDPGITFEATGLDYLVVDELHSYKNLRTVSNISDANIEGSKRATDLHMKLEYLRSRQGARVGIGATATPIANSITEAYVMQKYMRPDLLKDAGIGSFDAWAATFGQTVTEMEMAPTGDGNFRLKTRFARFQNVPEMLRMWRVFADVKTASDLNLPTPAIRPREDGKRIPEMVIVPPAPEVSEYIAEIGERAAAVASKLVKPDEDNMLKISTDGRKASIDVRLVHPDVVPTGVTLLDAVADRLAREWRQTRELAYVDTVSGEPSALPGGLQLAFLDMGTPNAEKWNAYDELRLKLVERGLPAERVRFIHEAKNDAQKARLFAAARQGHVDVLIGSTEKMGAGTNVQARITALHHVDCPWRPGDLTQRDGRGVRQGNQNAEIALFRYAVERSFSGYMWQSIERKTKFIDQIMHGRLDAREIEDIGDAALTAAEAKALSSGNPLLLEKATADNELAKFERLEKAFQRSLLNLHHTREDSVMRRGIAERQLEELALAQPRVVDLSGDHFRMSVGGADFDSRAEAGLAIAEWAQRSGVRHQPEYSSKSLGVFASISGFDVTARLQDGFMRGTFVVMELDAVPLSSIQIERSAFLEGGVGLVRQLENRVSGIDRIIDQVTAHKVEAEAVIEDVDNKLTESFRHSLELDEARHRVASINTQLAVEAEAQNRHDVDRAAPAGAAVSADFPTSPAAALTASPVDHSGVQRPGGREPGTGVER